MAHAKQMTSAIRQCIQNCLDCYSMCAETANHCLTLGGKHAEAIHINLLNNCSQICQTSAAFMLAGSEFHQMVCGVCADVCRACAESCSSMAAGDDTMQRCAETCRRCADACQAMSGAGLPR
jgi:hypothetical protein